MAEPLTLVVTDLDGTLWDSDLQCHADSLAAVCELQARDDVVLLAASGRRRNSARRAMAANDISLPAVLLNGAVGYDFVAEELFHMRAFRNADLRRVLGVLSSHDLAPVAYLADTTAVAVAGVTTSERHLATLEGDLEWWSMDRLAERDDVLCVTMLGIAAELISGAHRELADDPAAEAAGFRDELYAPFSFQISPAGIDKMLGIDVFCSERNLAPDRVIAVGDAGNDIPMLQAADVAVVVAGAEPDVAALADYEIGPPTEGGWAEVLDLI